MATSSHARDHWCWLHQDQPSLPGTCQGSLVLITSGSAITTQHMPGVAGADYIRISHHYPAHARDRWCWLHQDQPSLPSTCQGSLVLITSGSAITTQHMPWVAGADYVRISHHYPAHAMGRWYWLRQDQPSLPGRHVPGVAGADYIRISHHCPAHARGHWCWLHQDQPSLPGRHVPGIADADYIRISHHYPARARGRWCWLRQDQPSLPWGSLVLITSGSAITTQHMPGVAGSDYVRISHHYPAHARGRWIWLRQDQPSLPARHMPGVAGADYIRISHHYPARTRGRWCWLCQDQPSIPWHMLGVAGADYVRISHHYPPGMCQGSLVLITSGSAITTRHMPGVAGADYIRISHHYPAHARGRWCWLCQDQPSLPWHMPGVAGADYIRISHHYPARTRGRWCWLCQDQPSIPWHMLGVAGADYVRISHHYPPGMCQGSLVLITSGSAITTRHMPGSLVLITSGSAITTRHMPGVAGADYVRISHHYPAHARGRSCWLCQDQPSLPGTCQGSLVLIMSGSAITTLAHARGRWCWLHQDQPSLPWHMSGVAGADYIRISHHYPAHVILL